MAGFDPTSLGFVLLNEHKAGGVVTVYEYKNHPLVNGRDDYLRLNAYMTKDEDFVTIWWGLLEYLIIEGRFNLPHQLGNFSFHEQYDENLFRGYIENNEVGHVILKSLRIENRIPNILQGEPDDLRCEILT